MERGESGWRSRKAVGLREISERRPLGCRQPFHDPLSGCYAPQVKDQLGNSSTVYFQLFCHAYIVAFKNYLDKIAVSADRFSWLYVSGFETLLYSINNSIVSKLLS
jgi:hypothetical protein